MLTYLAHSLLSPLMKAKKKKYRLPPKGWTIESFLFNTWKIIKDFSERLCVHNLKEKPYPSNLYVPSHYYTHLKKMYYYSPRRCNIFETGFPFPLFRLHFSFFFFSHFIFSWSLVIPPIVVKHLFLSSVSTKPHQKKIITTQLYLIPFECSDWFSMENLV